MKRCDGCPKRPYDSYSCSFMVLEMRHVCPCKSCIVKVMCQTYCDDYDSAREFATKFKYDTLGLSPTQNKIRSVWESK